MMKIIEAYYCKPLHFLKIRGKISTSVNKIEIYSHISKTYLGQATLGTWAWGGGACNEKSGNNFIFHKVIRGLFARKVSLKVFFGDGTIKKVIVTFDITNDIPEQFVSSIGTKKGLIVDDNEEFIQKQIDCQFKPGPRLVHIESSSLCNLRCKYCVVSNNYMAIERGIISKEVLNAALKSINELPSVNTIQVSGFGEPLTNPNFVNLLWEISEKTKINNIWFFSNGMLLTKEISDEIAKIPLDFKIFFSIDGRNEHENEKQRVGSVYSVVKENIIYFLKQIQNKPNFRVKIHNLIIAGENERIYTPAFLLNDFGFISIDSHRAFYFPELERETLEKNGIKMHIYTNKKICKRIFSQVTIRSNGDVVRCHWDSTCSEVMGNILDKSLKEIFESDNYINFRKKMLFASSVTELPESCQKCHVMNEGYLYK